MMDILSTIDEVTEEILACYKELIEISKELGIEHEDEVKSVCSEIVRQLHKLKDDLYY